MATYRNALVALLRQSRGPESRDGKGVNCFDAPIAWDLAGKPYWTAAQENIVKKLIYKYRRQILNLGFNLDKLQTEAHSQQFIEIDCKWILRSKKAHKFLINGKTVWIGDRAFSFIREDSDGVCTIKISLWLAKKEGLC